VTLGRRAFLKLSSAAAIGPCLAPLPSAAPSACQADSTHILRIRAARVELAPGRYITTTTYDGLMPGPLLRAAVGQRTIIDIYNETDAAERIHWHGHNIAMASVSDIPSGSMRRVELRPARPGLYFYHSNRIAAARLDSGLYSGQVGTVLVEPDNSTAAGDPESVVVLKGCEPYLYRTLRGCEVGDKWVTVNGRLPVEQASLPFGSGKHVLLHVLNASATQPHTLELPGHSFEVVALDGCPVPSPARVARLYLSPAERVAAWVAPQQPTAWSVQSQGAQPWDYTQFGCATRDVHSGEPAAVLDIVLSRCEAARSGLNRWLINGTSFSASQPRSLLRLHHGLRYRLRIHNTSDEIVPIHLQRHRLEIVKVDGAPTRGVLKDVVTISPRQEVEVELLADSPGRALLYCSRQLHRDFGLMALVDYT
jgi:FtsP/CotA-like multicopper oxidase with cupredoxin domain